MLNKCALSVSISIVFFSALSFARAAVNEGLETATIYVDAKTGSDSNSGSQSAPLKTIGAAVSIAQTNNASAIGTKVIINPGTYRECLSIHGGPNQNSSKPMTSQAAQNGTVFVSGAVQYTSWAAYVSKSADLHGLVAEPVGLCAEDGGNAPLEQRIVRCREMIFVNGVPMTQVLSLGQMVYPGTFFVDETRAVVYMWPFGHQHDERGRRSTDQYLCSGLGQQ